MDGYKNLDPDTLQAEYEAFLFRILSIVRQNSEEIDVKFCYNQFFSTMYLLVLKNTISCFAIK